MLDITPLGWLDRKASTHTKKNPYVSVDIYSVHTHKNTHTKKKKKKKKKKTTKKKKKKKKLPDTKLKETV